MIEGTPASPYGCTLADLLLVEPSMLARRKEVTTFLKEDESILSMTHFPLLGVGDFCFPKCSTNGPVFDSDYIPDEVRNPHPRFGTLAKNIRTRKGRKVDINLPIFMDSCTVCPTEHKERQLPGHIYGDCMAFGMGSSCVQCTFQCCNIDEARDFYDSLVPFAPIMLALTANCPIFRGYLVDRDCRWNIIASSVDSRRDEEHPFWKVLANQDLKKEKNKEKKEKKGKKEKKKGKKEKKEQKKKEKKEKKKGKKEKKEKKNEKDNTKKDKGEDDSIISSSSPPQHHASDSALPIRRTGEEIGASGGSFYGVINKSRYGSVSLYIGNSERYHERYNDLDLKSNPWVFKKLVDAGFDQVLARHFSHLFIQDPMVVYRNSIQLDDRNRTDHFENIQSTNWQSCRFKPPPAGSDIGWRVEFRPMELQFHDFENAALVIFISLLVRVLAQFRLNLYVPISAVDVNMERSQLRDAVKTQKFYWRKNCLPNSDENDGMVELTVNEIINGSDGWVGMIPLVRRYLETKQTPKDLLEKLNGYLNFVSDRASGKIQTGASWQRQFVLNHPSYKKDSVVNDEIAFDMIKAIDSMQRQEKFNASFYAK